MATKGGGPPPEPRHVRYTDAGTGPSAEEIGAGGREAGKRLRKRSQGRGLGEDGRSDTAAEEMEGMLQEAVERQRAATGNRFDLVEFLSNTWEGAGERLDDILVALRLRKRETTGPGEDKLSASARDTLGEIQPDDRWATGGRINQPDPDEDPK